MSRLGYSWLTNQRGLTVDNVINYELVLPNGTVTNVNAGSNSELFWGLKGGFNNYVRLCHAFIEPQAKLLYRVSLPSSP
jgi:hypothetical protein